MLLSAVPFGAVRRAFEWWSAPAVASALVVEVYDAVALSPVRLQDGPKAVPSAGW
jgi:hypothetical protein